jgi:hypothetical protein
MKGNEMIMNDCVAVAPDMLFVFCERLGAAAARTFFPKAPMLSANFTK